MTKKHLLAILSMLILCSMVCLGNTTYALNIEKSAPNSLTVEQSKEISRQELKVDLLLVIVPLIALTAIIIAIIRKRKKAS